MAVGDPRPKEEEEEAVVALRPHVREEEAAAVVVRHPLRELAEEEAGAVQLHPGREVVAAEAEEHLRRREQGQGEGEEARAAPLVLPLPGGYFQVLFAGREAEAVPCAYWSVQEVVFSLLFEPCLQLPLLAQLVQVHRVVQRNP